MKTRILYVFTFFLVMISTAHSQLIEGYCEAAHISSPAEYWDYEDKLGGEFSVVVNAQTRKPFLAPLKNSHLVFRINPDGAHDENDNPIPFATIKAVVQRAIDAWNNVASSYVTFEVSDIPYSGTAGVTDGVSCIGFGKGLEMEVLARAAWCSPSPSQNPLTEVDIILISYNLRRYSISEPLHEVYMRWNTNIRYPEEYEFYNNPIKPSYTVESIGPIDMQDVITHELGHAIGLWHVPFAFTYHTMRPTNYSVPNWWEKTHRRTLENGDKAGKIFESPDFSVNSTQAVPHILLSSQTTININGSFTIPSGYIFEVEPGVIFNFASGTSITSYGNFKAVGTLSSPITFTSSTTGGTWSGIILSGSSANNSQLTYATISNVLTYGGSALGVYGATNVTIDHCTISNNVNYGTSGISLINAGSPNISYNTITNNGSYGIKYQNTSGDIWKNTIQGNSSGGISLYNASPNFGHSGFPAYYGNNVITDGSYGIYASYYSYPYVGSQYNSYYGYNSIYNNSTARVSATAHSEVLAEQNWWGSYPPSSLWFQPDGTSLIEYNPSLQSPPGQSAAPLANAGNTSASSEKISVESNIKTNDYWSAREAVLRGEPERAAEILSAIVKNSTDAKTIDRAFAEFITLAQFSPENSSVQALILFFKNRTYQSNFAKINLARLYAISGERSQALQLYQSAKGSDYTKAEFKLASLNEFYDNLLYGDASTAKQNLTELKKHFEDNAEVKEAAWLFEVMKNKPSENNNDNSGNESAPIVSTNVVLESRLENYPNPFNPSTTISYSLPQASNVTLKIYDALGREVATLVNSFKSEGVYNVQFNASSLASGIYLYRLQAGSYVETKKLVLMK